MNSEAEGSMSGKEGGEGGEGANIRPNRPVDLGLDSVPFVYGHGSKIE